MNQKTRIKRASEIDELEVYISKECLVNTSLVASLLGDWKMIFPKYYNLTDECLYNVAEPTSSERSFSDAG